MYRQLFFDEQVGELEHVTPLREHVSDRIEARRSAFHTARFRDAVIIAAAKTASRVVALLEFLIGSRLYVRDVMRELSSVDPSIRRALLYLLEKGFISSWARRPCAPDMPPITYYKLDLNPIEFLSGRSHQLRGSVAAGRGADANEALRAAIAEGVERYSVSKWVEDGIVQGSYSKLRHRGAISPKTFDFFTESQRNDAVVGAPTFEHIESAELGWVRAKELISNHKTLVPAQLAYIFYEEEHQAEPWFLEATTSGCAAAMNFAEAAYRAICELVERDSILVHWLNHITPPQVDLDSVDIPEVREKVAVVTEYGLEIHALDVTTDLGVPTYLVVILDKKGEVAVSVGSSADLDARAALSKAFKEVGGGFHASRHLISNELREELKTRYPKVRSINERYAMWADQCMLEHLERFLHGERHAFCHTKSRQEALAQNKLEKVRRIFNEKNYPCYLVDAASPLSRHFGLEVVRALAPDLVPLYFNESRKPLGVERLYTAPVAMGVRTTTLRPEELNKTPHPLL